MQASRRKVLSFIGLSPFAAKVASDKAIAEIAGIQQFGGLPGAIGCMPYLTGIPETATQSFHPPEPTWQKALRWFTKNELPAWKLRDLREEAKQIHCLEPDIAAKRSWSMSVKIQEQRERNYQRLIERTKRNIVNWGIRQDFEDKHGFGL